MKTVYVFRMKTAARGLLPFKAFKIALLINNNQHYLFIYLFFMNVRDATLLFQVLLKKERHSGQFISFCCGKIPYWSNIPQEWHDHLSGSTPVCIQVSLRAIGLANHGIEG